MSIEQQPKVRVTHEKLVKVLTRSTHLFCGAGLSFPTRIGRLHQSSVRTQGWGSNRDLST